MREAFSMTSSIIKGGTPTSIVCPKGRSTDIIEKKRLPVLQREVISRGSLAITFSYKKQVKKSRPKGIIISGFSQAGEGLRIFSDIG